MLPKQFQPKGTFELIRLGRQRDGGYLVCPSSIKSAKSLLSFGVSTDTSFEKSFLKLNNVPIHAYDPTIDSTFWKNYFKSKFPDPRAFYKPINYHMFFRGNRQHFLEWIGNQPKQTSLMTALNRLTDQQPCFASIDIEGSEYDILNEIIQAHSYLTGLTIEFHDVHKNKNTIEKFIQQFSLELIHIHPNNYAQLDDNGDPTVFEMTFAKNPKKLSDQATLPHPLDKPNHRTRAEIHLHFETDQDRITQN